MPSFTPTLIDPRLRVTTRTDIDRTVALIYELAEYEKLAHECHVTSDQLRTALFGESPALYGMAAFDGPAPAEDTSYIGSATQVGYALYFLNYSTWEGVHGIYLEDLYVTPEARGSGLGKAMLVALAATAAAHGFARVEWSVLDWNTPSIDFYRSLGAVPMDGWSTFRLTGAALHHLGNRLGQGRTASGTA